MAAVRHIAFVMTTSYISSVVDRDVIQAMLEELASKVGHREQPYLITTHYSVIADKPHDAFVQTQCRVWPPKTRPLPIRSLGMGGVSDGLTPRYTPLPDMCFTKSNLVVLQATKRVRINK